MKPQPRLLTSADVTKAARRMKPQPMPDHQRIKPAKRRPLRIRKRSASTIASARVLLQQREQAQVQRELSQAYLDRLSAKAVPPQS